MLCKPSSGCGAQVLSTGEAKLGCGTWLPAGQSPRCCRARPAGHSPSPRHRGAAAKVLLEKTSWLPRHSWCRQEALAGGSGRLFWQVSAGRVFSPFPTAVLPWSYLCRGTGMYAECSARHRSSPTSSTRSIAARGDSGSPGCDSGSPGGDSGSPGCASQPSAPAGSPRLLKGSRACGRDSGDQRGSPEQQIPWGSPPNLAAPPGRAAAGPQHALGGSLCGRSPGCSCCSAEVRAAGIPLRGCASQWIPMGQIRTATGGSGRDLCRARGPDTLLHSSSRGAAPSGSLSDITRDPAGIPLSSAETRPVGDSSSL